MTNSAHGGRRVVGQPTIQSLPADVHSLAAADEAIEWGECYGLTLDPDQQATLRGSLGERRDGSWAASEVWDVEGRQAGKNDTVKVRQGAGIDLFGERLHIHTAHEFATANEDFIRLVAIYEAYDDLRKSVQRIRYANGEQGIEFRSGARIKYRARTGGAGRGFTKADVVFYDEAQHVQPEHLGASFPTMLANPNFQAWFCGSGGFTASVVAWRARRRALTGGDKRFAYTENTAQIIHVRDDGTIELTEPTDLLTDAALSAHPGYANGRVGIEAMETMLGGMGREIFGREILNLWEPEPGEHGLKREIPASLWVSRRARTDGVAKGAALSVDVDPESESASIAAADASHIGVVLSAPGTAWVVEELSLHIERSDARAVGVEASGPVGQILPAIRSLCERKRVPLIELTTRRYAAACGELVDALRTGAVSHLGQEWLDTAVEHGRRRQYGDTWIWDRRTRVALSPLIAATVARRVFAEVPERSLEPLGAWV